MEAEHLAEVALVEAASELHDALHAQPCERVLHPLIVRYDAAFDRWVEGSQLDLGHSSFEQRAEPIRALAGR